MYTLSFALLLAHGAGSLVGIHYSGSLEHLLEQSVQCRPVNTDIEQTRAKRLRAYTCTPKREETQIRYVSKRRGRGGWSYQEVAVGDKEEITFGRRGSLFEINPLLIVEIVALSVSCSSLLSNFEII